MDTLFRTPDTRIASALITSGFPVESMSKDGSRVIFFFEREGTLLDQAVARYWMKTLLVDAQSLLIEHEVLNQRISQL